MPCSELERTSELKRTSATQLSLSYSNQPEPRLDGYYSPRLGAVGAGVAALYKARPAQPEGDIERMQAQLRALGCPDDHIETEVQRMLTDPERFAEIMEMDDSHRD